MTLSLFLRNLVFSLFVPGVVGFALPWLIISASGSQIQALGVPGVALIASGVVLYVWCVWQFGHVGRGTPGPWDAPPVFVATGPYLWVRNPMYIAVLFAVIGQAWLFMSGTLLVYGALVAVIVHLFVVTYEEPTLAEQFGDSYRDYRNNVPRWLPRPPGERRPRA